jgi:hypothetical protein
MGIPFVLPRDREPDTYKRLMMGQWGDGGVLVDGDTLRIDSPQKVELVNVSASERLTNAERNHDVRHNALFDYIKTNDKEPEAPVEVKVWEWRSPWLEGGKVWVRTSLAGDHYTWEQFDPTHERALRYGRLLASSEWAQSGDAYMLQRYVLSRKPLRLGNAQELALADAYHDRHGATIESVPLASIVPTQRQLDWLGVTEYMRGRELDPHNRLPFGVKFEDDARVYLLDGHHRYVARCMGKSPTMRMEVVSHATPLAHALEGGTYGADLRAVKTVLQDILEVWGVC